MRLLADECVDGRVIARFRAVGYDVLAIREMAAGAGDVHVLDLRCGRSAW